MDVVSSVRARLSPNAQIPPKQLYTMARKDELYDFLISDQKLVFPAQETPIVSILLVFWNRAELSLACLRSIADHVSLPYEVIVVDNHSEDETPLLLNRIGNAKIVRNDENRGFLLACNQAAQLASGRHLLLLNNDAALEPGCLEALAETLESDSEIGAVGGKIKLLDGTLQEAGSIMWRDGSCLGFGRGMQPEDPSVMYRRDVDYCSGALLMTPLALWQEVGGLDEDYQPAYYEETDYCARLLEMGLRIVYEPRAVVTHYEFGSSDISDFGVRQMRKNATLFRYKHQGLLSTRLEPHPDSVWQARSARRGAKTLLYIDDRVPHRYYGSGFPRANDIVTSLDNAGFEVTVVPYNFLDEEGWPDVYTDLPRTVEVLLGVGRHNLRHILTDRKNMYDVVWVSRPHNMSHFLKTIPRALYGRAQLVYDAEAVFALRDIAQAELAGKQTSAAKQAAALSQEMQLVQGVDQVIAVSEHERQLFVEHGGVDASQVMVLGHVLAPQPTPATFAERNGFLFIGNLDFPESPNADSLFWFADYVWPGIRSALGDVTLSVVGSAAETVAKRLGVIEGIRLCGRVEDLGEYYNAARAFIAPTRYAAGIPFKIHEASAQGLPVVATDLLAQQLGWSANEQLLSAPVSDVAEFAEHCIALHEDQVLWHHLRATALAAIERDCGSGHYRKNINSFAQHLDVASESH